jgi:hypothetical protein
MTIHCISFYEETWMVRSADRQQWNHVTGAYNCTFKLYDVDGFVWDDAVHNPSGLPVYLFDESGQQSLTDAVLPDDAIYVFGITGMNDVGLIPQESITGVIRIDTPAAKSLWGCEAAAIALSHRYMQSVS